MIFATKLFVSSFHFLKYSSNAKLSPPVKETWSFPTTKITLVGRYPIAKMPSNLSDSCIGLPFRSAPLCTETF